MDIAFSLTSLSGATFEEELGLQSQNYPSIHCSLFPSVIAAVRAMPPRPSPTHLVPIFNASGLVMPEHASVAYPSLIPSDLIFTISNTEIVQWLINGSCPTLAAKLAGARAFAVPNRTAGYAQTDSEEIGQAFNTTPVARGFGGRGAVAPTTLLRRLAAQRACFGVNMPPDYWLTDVEVPWTTPAQFHNDRASLLVSRNLSRELTITRRPVFVPNSWADTGLGAGVTVGWVDPAVLVGGGPLPGTLRMADFFGNITYNKFYRSTGGAHCGAHRGRHNNLQLQMILLAASVAGLRSFIEIHFNFNLPQISSLTPTLPYVHIGSMEFYLLNMVHPCIL